jgi:hypothetical protein
MFTLFPTGCVRSCLLTDVPGAEIAIIKASLRLLLVLVVALDGERRADQDLSARRGLVSIVAELRHVSQADVGKLVDLAVVADGADLKGAGLCVKDRPFQN